MLRPTEDMYHHRRMETSVYTRQISNAETLAIFAYTLYRKGASMKKLVLPVSLTIGGTNSFTETGPYPRLCYSVMGPSLIPIGKQRPFRSAGMGRALKVNAQIMDMTH